MFCFGFSSFYVVRVRFSLYCGRKYDFFQVFCFQLDLRSLFFGFEGFILRNLRSNSMKNSAIEKKFATRVRKKSDLNKEKGKFLTSKNFKIWQGQNLKISIFENCTNWKSENFKNLKRSKWKPKKLENPYLWDHIKLNACMHEMHANVHEMCARIHRSIQFLKGIHCLRFVEKILHKDAWFAYRL